MDRALSVTSYFYAEYLKKVSSDMSEMRMHKLMYFLQRELLIKLGTEPFHGGSLDRFLNLFVLHIWRLSKKICYFFSGR